MGYRSEYAVISTDLAEVGGEVSVCALCPLSDDRYYLVPTCRLYQPVVHP